MDLETVVQNYKYMAGCYMEPAENQGEMITNAKQHIGEGYRLITGKDMPNVVGFFFFKVFYGFYAHQYSLQCLISTPKGIFMSDPYLWPLNNFTSIARDLVLHGV